MRGIILQLLSGFSMGMVIFIVAAGLSLIFGVLKVLNMAHGAFYMLGAYFCFWLYSTFPDVRDIFWIAVILGPLGVAVIGAIAEMFLLRRIYERDMLYQLILTFGLILIIGDICKIVWGTGYYIVGTPWPFTGAVRILGVHFPIYNVFLICVGLIVFLGLWMMVTKTRLGAVIRAFTYNRDMVSALGINVPMIRTLVFMLGCWLAGLGGTLLAPAVATAPGMDMAIIIECFIILVIGGLGSLPGSLVGAIAFGLVNSFGILFIPQLAIVLGFVLMAVVLVVRPFGLMGRGDFP